MPIVIPRYPLADVTYPLGTYWNITYNGLAMGQGTPFGIEMYEGFENLPGIRSNDIEIADGDGFWPGEDLLGARPLRIGVSIKPTGVLDLETLIAALVRATPRTRSGSNQLVFAGGKYLAWARVKNRSVTRIKGGKYATAAIEFSLSDPLVYEATLRQSVLYLPSTTGLGFDYPLNWPLAIRSQATGEATVTNVGNEITYPVMVLQGPAPSPSIENVTAGATLRWGFALGSNDYLAIDTRSRSALLNGSGARAETLNSTWWALPPGDSLIRFRAGGSDPAASLTIQWRGALA